MDPYNPYERIFSCINGHFICERCKINLKEQVCICINTFS